MKKIFLTLILMVCVVCQSFSQSSSPQKDLNKKNTNCLECQENLSSLELSIAEDSGRIKALEEARLASKSISGNPLIVYVSMLGVLISFFSFCIVWIRERSLLRKNSLDLFEKWESAEFTEKRILAWDVLIDLKSEGAKWVVPWLCGDLLDTKFEDWPSNPEKNSYLAFREVFFFLANISRYIDLKLVDKKTSLKLFERSWNLWGDKMDFLIRKIHLVEEKRVHYLYKEEISNIIKLNNYFGIS